MPPPDRPKPKTGARHVRSSRDTDRLRVTTLDAHPVRVAVSVGGEKGSQRNPNVKMKKSELVKLIVAGLAESLSLLENAARASHAEATHESSKAESKYDTRGLEAAYLAGGQARQARELMDSIKLYQKLPIRDFTSDDPIDLTALVEVESGGARSLYYIGPRNGGLEIKYRGKEITVITPQSPLGQNLMEKKVGHKWTAKLGALTTKYQIVSVA
jgi:transcription elongation GreA/GreB family factor